MKSSNPKVMIEAYRLVVSKMSAEGMNYPLHLGVTEAGDGDDARIKSAIGIGSLLFDGLGDTIRVSLTEDPVNEIPVAKDLAEKAWRLWESNRKTTLSGQTEDPVDPFSYTRRKAKAVELKSGNSGRRRTYPHETKGSKD
jgi:(E)-4-hydroxy-3-methylbut-2-enyl-diphosphate synthase